MTHQPKRARAVLQQPVPQDGDSVAYVEYMLSGQFRRVVLNLWLIWSFYLATALALDESPAVFEI